MQRTAKLYDDDGHGEHVGLRLLLLVAVSMTARALSPQTNRRRMTKKRGAGRNTRSSGMRKDAELDFVLSSCCYLI